VAVAIVAGALANKPLNGGEAWVRLAWLLGLRRLGFDVHFVEALGDSACVDEKGEPCAFEASANRRHFESVIRAFGLVGKATLLDEAGGARIGLASDDLLAVAESAEAIFNISGHLAPGPLLAAPRRRVYIDLDPGFTQLWAADPALDFSVDGHDHHVSVGLNVGRPECPLPSAGVDWIPSLPPVLLGEWPAVPPPPGPLRWTTVATWRNPYGPQRIAGRTVGLKHHEFRRLIDLPRLVAGAEFELALDIHAADGEDLRALCRAGWRVVSPRTVAATPSAFRNYVRGSGAEFSVAQGVYVASASGWFSDRSGAYLASGRPALVQDTGIGAELPFGEGLLRFATPAEAVEGARRIASDPAAHAAAARAIAEAHLDSDLVLGRVLDAIGVAV
jgi:hypothetical protein